MMAEGGFGRDFHRAAVLRSEAQKRKDQSERDKTAVEVLAKLETRLQKKLSKIEKQSQSSVNAITKKGLATVLEKQEEDMKKFLDVIKEKDVILYISFGTLTIASYLFGYYSHILFGL